LSKIKTITFRRGQVEKVEHLKKRLKETSYSSLVSDAVEVLHRLLLSLEEEWRALCDRYGQFVPLEPDAELLKDYAVHLSYVARGKERPLGSEFLYRFGEKLAEVTGRPEEAEKLGREVNDDYWEKISCRQESSSPDQS